MKTLPHRTQRQAGFSLIELLVSIGLFSVVITMAVGTMIILLDANAKAQNMNVLMTNLSFALDSMSREIRTGFAYYCNSQISLVPAVTDTRDCPYSRYALSIVETGNSLTGGDRGSYTSDNRIIYYFDPSLFGPGHGAIMRRIGNNPAQPITSEEIYITSASFTVIGSDTARAGDLRTPLVRIFITGEAGDIEGLDTSFQLQTTVSQRLVEL